MDDEQSDITLKQMLGPYVAHPAMRAIVVLNNCAATLLVVNKLREIAAKDGVELTWNQNQLSLISGSGNGGVRPPDCPVGAAHSQHKNGNGLDGCDIDQSFMRWCLANLDVLRNLGVWLEHPQWTPHWTHMQRVAPVGWHDGDPMVFLPYNPNATPPTCAALPELKSAGIATYAFPAVPHHPV